MIATALMLVLAAPQHHGHAMPMAAPATGKAAARKAPPRRKAGTLKAKPMPRRAKPASDAAPACPPDHAAMGHCTPPTQTAPAPSAARAPVSADAPRDAAPACPPEHTAMGHCTPPAAAAPALLPAPTPPMACPPEHAAMGHCTAPAAAPDIAAGTSLSAGNGAAPPAPEPSYADRHWGRAAMLPARAAMRREHGGMPFSQVIFNIAEVQLRDGGDGYRWDGEGWFGGDINRFVVKSEGDGSFRGGAGGEVQALYSRAVGPYLNLQAGVRQDIGVSRRYATVGVEGLAPYWFDVEATAFLSDHGELLGRIEGYYDQRITQRLILQPRAEINLAAQSIAARDTGAGLVDAELGLRLRYEIRREFAPYVGVTWEHAFDDTRRRLRRAGDDTGGLALSIGLRSWF